MFETTTTDFLAVFLNSNLQTRIIQHVEFLLHVTKFHTVHLISMGHLEHTVLDSVTHRPSIQWFPSLFFGKGMGNSGNKNSHRHRIQVPLYVYKKTSNKNTPSFFPKPSQLKTCSISDEDVCSKAMTLDSPGFVRFQGSKVAWIHREVRSV